MRNDSGAALQQFPQQNRNETDDGVEEGKLYVLFNQMVDLFWRMSWISHKFLKRKGK